MKTIQLFLVLLMVGIPTMNAQSYKMVLKKTDGTTHEFPVEDIVEVSVEEVTPKLPLYVTVSENELTDPSTSSKSKRAPARAPIITTSSLSAFSMYGANTSYKLTKGSQWKASPNYWPSSASSNVDVTFYAYSDGTFNTKGNFIQFNVDGNAFEQKDLLVATTTTSNQASGGYVNLNFDHACAAVQFNMGMTSKLNGQLGPKELTVNSVTLKNVFNSGEYYYSEGWKNLSVKLEQGNNPSYTLTNSDITISTELQPLPCEYIFMIPQTLTDALLEVKYTVGSSEAKTTNIPLSNITWAAGRKYTINVKLNTSMIEL